MKPNFLFHVPTIGKVVDYNKLETMMRKKDHPSEVHVIDNINRRRLGVCNAALALLKYR